MQITGNSPQYHIIVAAICLALNVGLGKISNLLALPFTMDTVGTILAAALLPWPFVVATAALSSIVASVVIHPVFIFYIGTQIVIAVLAIALVRLNFFNVPIKAALAGLIIGVASAIVSAPVTAIVFGGVSVPSITALNAVFLASGKSLWQSVIGGALIVESIDKIAAGVMVWLALKRIRTPDE